MIRPRRLFLGSITLVLVLLPRIVRALPTLSGPDAAPDPLTLRAFLDTLIPADETPSASALGVDRALLEIARAREGYLPMVEQGMAWLDRSARALGAKSFVAASEAQRAAVVAAAERAQPRTLPRTLFERVRADALRLYYAQPAACAGLGYTGPPQPVGFPDFERPPAQRP
jgi:hypothetical protein